MIQFFTTLVLALGFAYKVIEYPNTPVTMEDLGLAVFLLMIYSLLPSIKD